MRVTQQMLDRSLLQGINERMSGLEDLNRKLSSGRKISTVSDDPVASAQILRAQRTEGRIDTCLRNIDSVDAMLSTVTSSLQAATETTTRVRQLATQAATGTYAEVDRGNIAREIEESIESLVSLANTRVNGEYVFSGATAEVRPFQLNRNAEGEIERVAYRGASSSTEATIAPDRTASVNMVGSEVFEREGDLFDTLVRLRDAVKSSNQKEIQALLGKMETGEDGLRASLGIAGARQNQLELVRNQLEGFSQTNREILSEVGDTDIAEASMNYQRNMMSLQWALKVSAQAARPSLVDYL